MKTIKAEINGEMIEAVALKVGNTLWAHINGRTVVYESQKARSSKREQHAADPGKIKTPMPGKIIKVMCAAGDKVKKEQTLVVMEAMKMEYSLKSFIDGKVEKVNCAAGDQVGVGQLLVELSGEGDGKN
jgi:acetyl/propionyl-CoA carboxylase alpha subunit